MNQQLLKRLFQRKRFLTLNISPTALTLAYVQSSEHDLKVLYYDVKFIQDFESLNDEQLSHFISNFLDNNYIVDRDIVLSLDGIPGVVIKELSLPKLSDEEQSPAILWQMINEQAIDNEDYFLAWQFLPDELGEGKKEEKRILAVAFKESQAKRYFAILEQCHLITVSLTHPVFHRHHLLTDKTTSEELTAVLYLQFKHTHLLFYQGRNLIFFRSLPLALEQLLNAIGSGKHLYWNEGESKEHFYASIDESQASFMHMRSFLDMLIREIQLSKEYCKAHFSISTLKHFIMAGESCSIKNLGQYLSKALGVDVQNMVIPKNVCQIKLSPKNSFGEDRIADCLAVSLEKTKKANALPLELRTRKIERIQNIVLWSVASTLLVIFIFLIIRVQTQVEGGRQQLINARYNLNILKEILPLRERLNSWVVLREHLILKDVPVEGIMKFISRSVPDGLYLDDLFIETDRREMILTGRIAPDQINPKQILTEFVNSLEGSIFIKHANILYANKDDEGMAFRIKGEIVDR